MTHTDQTLASVYRYFLYIILKNTKTLVWKIDEWIISNRIRIIRGCCWIDMIGIERVHFRWLIDSRLKWWSCSRWFLLWSIDDNHTFNRWCWLWTSHHSKEIFHCFRTDRSIGRSIHLFSNDVWICCLWFRRWFLIDDIDDNLFLVWIDQWIVQVLLGLMITTWINEIPFDNGLLRKIRRTLKKTNVINKPLSRIIKPVSASHIQQSSELILSTIVQPLIIYNEEKGEKLTLLIMLFLPITFTPFPSCNNYVFFSGVISPPFEQSFSFSRALSLAFDYLDE